MKNADKPANPIEINGFGQYAPEAHTGLTKREMFAMRAMQGVVSNSFGDYTSPEWDRNIAEESVKLADALLAELEK